MKLENKQDLCGHSKFLALKTRGVHMQHEVLRSKRDNDKTVRVYIIEFPKPFSYKHLAKCVCLFYRL